jgi:hypothetical protein
MAGRFQFSLRQLLLVVTLICVAIGLLTLMASNPWDTGLRLFELYACVVTLAAIVGAWFGAICGKPWLFANVFAVIAAILIAIFIVLLGGAVYWG